MFQARLDRPPPGTWLKDDHVEQAIGRIRIRQQGDARLEPTDVADHYSDGV